MKPLISIVISLYNYEKYISECINSVLNQTITNFELIVVNNGSTDNSREVVTTFKDSRMTLLEIETNNGIGPALNLGIEQSTGSWIYCLPADDYLVPTFLEEMLAEATSSNSKAVVCWMGAFSDNERIDLSECQSHEDANNLEAADLSTITDYRWKNIIAFNIVMYKSDILKACLPFPSEIAPMDWAINIRAAKLINGQVPVIQKKLVKYRWHGENLGKRIEKERYLMEYFYVHLYYYRQVVSDIPNRKEEFFLCHQELVTNAVAYFDDANVIARLIMASERSEERPVQFSKFIDFQNWLNLPIEESGNVRIQSINSLTQSLLSMKSTVNNLQQYIDANNQIREERKQSIAKKIMVRVMRRIFS